MAKGNLQEYDHIKSKDIMEFWSTFNMWFDKLKKDTKKMKHGR